jgi:hypothetical protein
MQQNMLHAAAAALKLAADGTISAFLFGIGIPAVFLLSACALGRIDLA